MESIESLKDYLISDEIQRIESLDRVELVRELIEEKARKIESLRDLVEIKNYGKGQSKN
jgi:uncharacterized pyridoxal phosphate-containing UPF0001 family protein